MILIKPNDDLCQPRKNKLDNRVIEKQQHEATLKVFENHPEEWKMNLSWFMDLSQVFLNVGQEFE